MANLNDNFLNEDVVGVENTTTAKTNVHVNNNNNNGDGDVHTPRRTGSISGSYTMMSRYGTIESPVSKDIVEVFKQLEGVNAVAEIATVAKGFKGVFLKTTQDGVAYSQIIVIDERPVLNLEEIVAKTERGEPVLFGSIILSGAYKNFLEKLTIKAVDTIALPSILINASDYTNKIEDIRALLISLLMRFESYNFSNVKDVLNADRSKPIMSNVYNSGQDVKLDLTHRETNLNTIRGTLSGFTDNLLTISARVDGVVAKKDVVEYSNGHPVTRQGFCYRPIVYIKGYEREGSFVGSNLEYALLAVATSTVLLDKDKVIKSLLPVGNLNIGALNPILSVIPGEKGNYAITDLTNVKFTLNDKMVVIQKIIGDASLGIDIEYRTDVSALSTFADLIDKDSENNVTRAVERIAKSYKNLTGKEYNGKVTEKTIIYPSGTVTDKSGSDMELSKIDSIWLASNGYLEEAKEWLTSDLDNNSLMMKMKILEKIAKKTALDFKIKSIGLKIILDVNFIKALIENSEISVESKPVLELPSETATFGNFANVIGTTTSIGSVSYAPTGMNFGNNAPFWR